jgi:hypothetical protein
MPKPSSYNVAVVYAAAHSRYTPEIYRCTPVNSSYLYAVDFDKH